MHIGLSCQAGYMYNVPLFSTELSKKLTDLISVHGHEHGMAITNNCIWCYRWMPEPNKAYFSCSQLGLNYVTSLLMICANNRKINDYCSRDSSNIFIWLATKMHVHEKKETLSNRMTQEWTKRYLFLGLNILFSH